jgi:hypothetical protein
MLLSISRGYRSFAAWHVCLENLSEQIPSPLLYLDKVKGGECEPISHARNLDLNIIFSCCSG